MSGGVKDGLLLLNKKSGVTSFESLHSVKRAFATGKAGHTGTLDKFATGLLLVLLGKGLKLASLLSACDKEYVATVRFGEETDTLDPEGEIIARAPLPSLTDVESVLDAFRGKILQSPPVYSAIHIDGRRAHELAREGKTPEMKKRPVTIYSLDIVSFSPPDMIIKVRCSSGTYIRSLAGDIAKAAGSRAHLSALQRTSVGNFHLRDSTDADSQDLTRLVRPLDRKLFSSLDMPCFFLDEERAKDFLHGKQLSRIISGEGSNVSEEIAAGVFRKSSFGQNGEKDGGEGDEETGELLGFIRGINGTWRYGHVFQS